MAANDSQILTTRLVYCSERGGDGFTAGLYLFVVAELLKVRLTGLGAGVGISFAGIAASPTAWAVGLLVPTTFFIALFEIPAGFIADRLGPRFAVISSWIFRSGYFLAWWIISAFVTAPGSLVAIAYIATLPFAVGYALRSGANQAWLHHALSSAGLASDQLDSTRNAINNLSVWVYWTATLAGSLLSMVAMHTTPQIAFFGGAVVCVSYVIGLCLTMKDCRGKMEESEPDGRFDYWRPSSRWTVLLFVACVAGAFMVLADLVDHTWFIAFSAQAEGMSDTLGLVAAMGIAAIIGSVLAMWADARFDSTSPRNEIFRFSVVAALFGLAHLEPGFFPGFFGMLSFLGFKELVRGAFDGPKENLIQGLIPADNRHRALIISCVNQTGNLMVAGVSAYVFALKQEPKPDLLIAIWGFVGMALLVCSVLLLVGCIYATKPAEDHRH